MSLVDKWQSQIDLHQFEINKIKIKISEVQKSCTHPEEYKIRTGGGANTGNYDPSSDCYWSNYHCELCNKKWTEYYDAK